MVLSARKIPTITKPGRYSDSNGLHLFVQASGRRSWVLRATLHGKRRDMGLGPYPETSLTEARSRAVMYKAVIANGVDPRMAKVTTTTETDWQALGVPTFRQATHAYYERHSPNLKNGKHAKNWMQVLERHVMPVLGEAPVDEIDGPDVLAVLDAIWTTRPPTARRVRQRMRSIFSWCLAHGYIDFNPAGEAIDGGLTKQPASKNHFRAAHYSEVGEILAIVDASTANESAKLALEFVVLTAARSGEARGATWDEIDLGARTWTIPASRMKAGVEHRVPLSDQALDVLERARGLDNGSGAIFPSPQRRRKTLSDMTFSQLLRRERISNRTTPHGMRTAFRVWAAEKTTASWAACEAALAHRVGNAVEQAYARTDWYAERVGLMQAWADFILPTAA